MNDEQINELSTIILDVFDKKCHWMNESYKRKLTEILLVKLVKINSFQEVL